MTLNGTILGFTGYSGVGKTTAAEFLVNNFLFTLKSINGNSIESIIRTLEPNNLYVIDDIVTPEQVYALSEKARFRLVGIKSFPSSSISEEEWKNIEICYSLADFIIFNEKKEGFNRFYDKLEHLLNIIERPGWNEYFMRTAMLISKRSTCDRNHVGAILVKDNNIIASGYNGSLPGAHHCDDEGHIMENNHCIRTVHAEKNALLQAAKRGIPTEGATIYVTSSPCFECFKALIAAGVKEIYYYRRYCGEEVFEAAERLGIKIEQVNFNSRRVID